MTERSAIKGYLYCAACLSENIPSDLAVGVTNDGGSLVVWCEAHDKEVVTLELKDDLMAECAICGKPVGNHTH